MERVFFDNHLDRFPHPHFMFRAEHLVGSRLDLGMNDLDSPIWASDHFAVVATLRFHPPPLPPTPYSHRTNAIHDTEL